MTGWGALRRAARHLLHSEHDFAAVRRKGQVLMVRGQGSTVWDAQGRAYLDAQAGLCLVNVGYGRDELVQAAARQMAELPYYHTYWRFATPPAAQLAARLVTLAPPGLEHVYLTPGGAEAVEAAVKLARLYQRARGRADKDVVVAFRNGYHGSTFGALAATGLEPHRQGFGPLPGGFAHVEPGDPDALERTLDALGPARVAAVLAEPITAVGGVVTPPPEYWPRVRQLCDAHDILLIADEVLTGVGRCGTLWALHGLYGVTPDLLVTAKGLTSGYAPLGAVLIHRAVVDALADAQLPFLHGHTFGGHPVACAVALAAVEMVLRERLPERAARMGQRLAEALAATGNPYWGEPVGRGLLLGLPLRRGDRPWPQGAQFDVEDACLERGLIVGVCPYTPMILLTPPLVLTEGEADTLVATLDAAVRAVGATLT